MGGLVYSAVMRVSRPPNALPNARRQALKSLGAFALSSGLSPSPWAQPNPSAAGTLPAPPPLGQKVLLPPLTWISELTWTPPQLEGHVTVVYWWASWCPFCREQTPQIQALWERHAQQGLRVLGISVDRQAQTARAYLKRGGYTFACAWYDEALARVFARPSMIPSLAVLDRQARVVQSERGQLFPEDVAALSRWLSQP